MSYDLATIKSDLQHLSEEQFYTKYIVCSDNWYLDNVLNIPKDNHVYITEQYRLIIGKKLKISINSITMVGSGKVGYSASNENKVLKVSDLDIAIISSKYFNEFWQLIKKSYQPKYKGLYENHIFKEIYRGYINEDNVQAIDGCRKVWNDLIIKVKKELTETLYIKNDITFRLYNTWEDFQDYNIQNIRKLKRGMQI